MCKVFSLLENHEPEQSVERFQWSQLLIFSRKQYGPDGNKKSITRLSLRDFLPAGTEAEEKPVEGIALMKISSPCCFSVLHSSISTCGIKDFMIKNFSYLSLFSPRSLRKFAGKFWMEFCGIWIRYSGRGLRKRSWWFRCKSMRVVVRTARKWNGVMMHLITYWKFCNRE